MNNIEDNKETEGLSDTQSRQLEPYTDRWQTFILVHKKTEKLASAIYIVTNLLSDHEPMKWNLRKKSSELASYFILYKDTPESGLYDFTQGARTRVLDIVSMLEILSAGGLISPMNFAVLKQEFSNLITMLNVTHDSARSDMSNTLPRHFFSVSDKEKNSDFTSNFTLLSNKDIYRTDSNIVKDKTDRRPNIIGKTSRQNTIINLLKRKKELTIKDISQVIKDCSEKTIQRELISLISMGVVRKTGERRWSKYSLLEQ